MAQAALPVNRKIGAAEERPRIGAFAADQKLKMQVFARRQPGLAHEAEAVAGGDAVAGADADGPAFQMVVAGPRVSVVRKLDEVPKDN